MIVLGIDPGPTTCAWAEVDCRGRRPRYLRGGILESIRVRHLASLNVAEVVPYDLCYVEKSVPPHPGGKVKTPQAWVKIVSDLMATTLVAGEAYGAIGEYFPNVDYVTSHEVRRALCGSRDATDAEVKQALSLQVDAMPRRSNNHVRDAMATAIVGHRMYERKRL